MRIFTETFSYVLCWDLKVGTQALRHQAGKPGQSYPCGLAQDLRGQSASAFSCGKLLANKRYSVTGCVSILASQTPAPDRVCGQARCAHAQQYGHGLLASMLPHGGIGKVAGLAGLDEKTVARGKAELELGLKDYPDDGRVRRPGGGRPRLEKKLPASRRNSPKSSNRKRVAIPKDATGTFEAA